MSTLGPDSGLGASRWGCCRPRIAATVSGTALSVHGNERSAITSWTDFEFDGEEHVRKPARAATCAIRASTSCSQLTDGSRLPAASTGYNMGTINSARGCSLLTIPNPNPNLNLRSDLHNGMEQRSYHNDLKQSHSKMTTIATTAAASEPHKWDAFESARRTPWKR